ncbi:VWA domain-containing protein [Psychrosphaera sp.]|nr:VWA domain-containing protein [Psychrosphaera sp.]
MFFKSAKLNLTLSFSMVALLLQGCSGSDSDKTTNIAPNTASISGSINGLAGQVTVSLNGNEQTFTTNGDFTFSTRVTLDESYNVTLVSQPTGLNCNIANANGTVTGNVSNIDITCSGLEGTAYSLNNLGFSAQAPSVLTFAFHLVDRFTGKAVEALTTSNVKDYLRVTENDLPVSTSESFLEVDPLVGLDSIYTTVFAIDISASLTEDDLNEVISSIKGSISDSNGDSLLAPNQRISIYTFDSNVQLVVENDRDIDSILTALNSISVGGNSTNLFGGIKQSAESWENEISTELVSYGSLVLFTDGNDSSGLVSKENALASVASKDIYFIVLGEESNTQTLAEFTPESNIFKIEDFNQLTTVLSSTLDFAKSYENGLYILSYATPKRAGSHELTIAANDDFDCQTSVNDTEAQQISDTGNIKDCVDEVSHTFDASGYTDIAPELELTGVSTSLAPSVDWQARVRWTNSTSDLDWQVESCVGNISVNVSEDKKTATFTRASDDFSMIYIEVTDLNTLVTQNGYLKMSDNESDIQKAKNQRDSELCNR